MAPVGCCAIERVEIAAKTDMKTVSFEELPGLAGQEIGVSDWLVIDQARVDAFSELMELPSSKTIAQDHLKLLLTMLAEKILQITDASRCINQGFSKVRFIASVQVGSRIRVRQFLMSAKKSGSKEDCLLLNNRMTVEVEGWDGNPCIAETLTLVYGTVS